jgi:hydroxyethylthiazole kinase-like sugar kinase family protein
VLDPVGCGATPYRTATAAELATLRPAIIRANASETLSLAGAAAAGPKGVDSTAGAEEIRVREKDRPAQQYLVRSIARRSVRRHQTCFQSQYGAASQPKEV